ncbi:MAG: EAL domain-containing protein [Desulfuromonadales bacterium]|nr:EAL domain-containing protein [Desulfuromonadales bacterium]
MDKTTILIIDDDPGLRKTLADILRVKGYETLVAGNGGEGLALLGEKAVNLVLIDLGLPDIPGLDVLARVRTEHPSTEAIILTGNATLESAIEATNRGAFSYLIKPYEMEQLMLQIRRAIEKQQAREALHLAHLAQEQRTAELAEANRTLEAEIVERAMAEEALKRSNRSLRLFSECNEILVHATSEPQLLNSICSEIVRVGGYSLAWVGYVKEGGIYPVAHAAHEYDCPGAAGRRFSTARCSVAEAIASITTDDQGRHMEPPYESWLDDASTHGCAGSVALPLKGNRGEVYGALNVHSAEPEQFGAEELKLFAELANDLSYGILSQRSSIERRRAEDALRLSQRAVESSSNGIIITDSDADDNPIIYVNPAFVRMTGYSTEEAYGRNPRFLEGDDNEQMGLADIRAALREQREGSAVLRNYRKDGSLFWNELSLSSVRDKSGRVTNFVGILNDITERKQYEEQLEFQSNHDGLTGLPNRNLLADRLAQTLSYADRYRQLAAVMFVDLDHFKSINDSLGQEIGDQLLKSTAERLEQCVRAIDTVARYGDDEFVIILPTLTEDADAVDAARRIQEAIGQPFKSGEDEFVITCSTGISVYPKDGADVQTLLKNADAAMYRAKELGRNNFQFYTTELNDKAVVRLTMEKYLRQALEKDELILHYQPQVDLATGRITGMEALIRWQSPELGLVPPDRFIPLAEETGLIVPIGEWVLRTSCAQNRAWQDAGFSPLVVAVNLSPRQFRQENLVERVSQVLQDTSLEARFLEIEIVESLVMHDVERVSTILGELKGLGVQLAMDDFGTGYSSLSYLKRFPFDKIKIDISFVREITTDPDSAAIAKAIIAMAHSMNLRVIAEGVETEGQLGYLRSNSCDDMQGFLFSRPVPSGEFGQMLCENRRLELPEEGYGRQDRTLLLVDDDENVIAALKRILDGDGYKIFTACSAVEGFEMLATNRIGVVVSDLRMPGMNGTEFLSRVKEMYPGIVRIMLSGKADMDSLSDAINHGAISKFLFKPWDDDLMRADIRGAFKHYEMINMKK